VAIKTTVRPGGLQQAMVNQDDLYELQRAYGRASQATRDAFAAWLGRRPGAATGAVAARGGS